MKLFAGLFKNKFRTIQLFHRCEYINDIIINTEKLRKIIIQNNIKIKIKTLKNNKNNIKDTSKYH